MYREVTQISYWTRKQVEKIVKKSMRQNGYLNLAGTSIDPNFRPGTSKYWTNFSLKFHEPCWQLEWCLAFTRRHQSLIRSRMPLKVSSLDTPERLKINWSEIDLSAYLRVYQLVCELFCYILFVGWPSRVCSSFIIKIVCYIFLVFDKSAYRI